MRRPEVATARKLRRAMSFPEVMLWQRLRRSPSGLRFRRQHPIGPYVVDFYCHAASLVIEIDGKVHDDSEQAARDARRQSFLEGDGYHVTRVSAARVMSNVDAAADAIVALAARPLHQPLAGPPPRAGEDQE